MYVPHGGEIDEMSSETGGLFFVISLPMLAQIEAERRGLAQAA